MKNYLPKGKGDLDAIAVLKTLPFETVRSDVPELLNWFQDFNWGLANPIAEYLACHVNEIDDELITILSGNDGEWKRGILAGLVDKTPVELNHELITAITRLARFPSSNDKDEGVDLIAEKIISENSNRL